MSSDHVFSFDEATRALPEVERIVVRLRELHRDAQPLAVRLEILWKSLEDGARVLDEIASLQKSLDAHTAELTALFEELTARGCIVRDLDSGLVDFPAIARGVPIFLCWRLGEEGIQYWHSREEGFAGRKPLWKMPGTGPNYA